MSKFNLLQMLLPQHFIILPVANPADYNLTVMALKNILTKAREINSRVVDDSFRRPLCSLLNWDSKDVETHTGQKWEKDDYRLCRYVGKTKLVNPNWAVKLIDQAPPKAVKGRVTWCDGGGGPTGHPRVYINLDKPGNHACLYCGLRFFKDESEH